MPESNMISNFIMFPIDEVARIYNDLKGLNRNNFEEKTGLRFSYTKKIKRKRYYFFEIMNAKLCSYARIKYGF